MIKKIIAGGQTGVDRAALDAALKFNIPIGGWCPHGRKAEDGIIPQHYPLKETESGYYEERTRFNVRDSDGTLILVFEMPIHTMNGTQLTIEEAKKIGKPFFIVNLSKPPLLESLQHWMKENRIEVLNIAGPRESQSPGIAKLTFQFLERFLSKDAFQSS
jgi:hypothetical protein